MKKRMLGALALVLLAGCGAPAASQPVSSGEAAPAAVRRLALPESGERLALTEADGAPLLMGWDGGQLQVWRLSQDNWQPQALALPEEVQPTAVENLMPGGTALVSAVDSGGEVCLLEGGPDRPFAPVQLPEAEEFDGFRSPCRAGDGLSLTLTRYETFTDEQGRTQTTVVPLPVENRMYGPDGQAAVWGDGPAGDVYTTPVSDGQRMYCVDLTDNGLVTVEADGSWRKEGVLEGWNGGALFARDGRVYYPGKDGVCCWPDGAVLRDAGAPWTQSGIFVSSLCVTDRQVLALCLDTNTEEMQLYAWTL